MFTDSNPEVAHISQKPDIEEHQGDIFKTDI